MATQSKSLIAFDNKTIMEALSVESGLRPVLDKVREAAKEFGDDVSTATSRKAIVSGSRKVVSFKTAANKIGKDSVSEAREKIKLVDANLKDMRDELDEIRDEVRAPVTEWEKEEETRVNVLHGRIDAIRRLGEVSSDEGIPLALDVLISNKAFLDETEVSEKIFGKKMEMEAFKAKATAEQYLSLAIEREKTRIAQKDELDLLRAESAARAKREAEAEAKRQEEEAAAAAIAAQEAHDKMVAEEAKREAEKERVAAENAAAQAKIDAENAKKAEEEAEQRRIQAEKDADEAASKAKADRIAAKKRADDEAKEAAEEAEKEKVAAAKRAKEAEIQRQKDEQTENNRLAKEREENEKHVKTVNMAAAAVLKREFALSDTFAIDLIEFIAAKEVPNVRISY